MGICPLFVLEIAVQNLIFCLSLLCGFLIAPIECKAQSSVVTYRQHWSSPGDTTPYATGMVTAQPVTGTTCPTNLDFSISLKANAASVSNGEWKNGRNSLWDVATKDSGGSWRATNPQLKPSNFKDNPGGVLDVTLSVPLDGAAGSTNSLDFELYGTCDDLNVSPPRPSAQTMIAVPGTITWTLDADKKIATSSVNFGTVQQARGLDGLGNGTFPRRKTAPLGKAKVSVAETSYNDAIEVAERELFGSDRDLSYTSHFNFDNRVFDNDPNPPTAPKYRCLVECVLANGRHVTFSNSNLRKISVDDWRVLQIDQQQVHVVKCRFSWRLSPNGARTFTDWAASDEGTFFSYVFLVWHGQNDYEIVPTQESLAFDKESTRNE